jgi:hypothetical protein
MDARKYYPPASVNESGFNSQEPAGEIVRAVVAESEAVLEDRLSRR